MECIETSLNNGQSIFRHENHRNITFAITACLITSVLYMIPQVLSRGFGMLALEEGLTGFFLSLAVIILGLYSPVLMLIFLLSFIANGYIGYALSGESSLMDFLMGSVICLWMYSSSRFLSKQHNQTARQGEKAYNG